MLVRPLVPRIALRWRSERLLATAEFQPNDEMAGIPLNGLLQEFQSKRELLVIIANARGEPGDKPIARGEQLRFFEAIIGAGFLAGEEDVTAREPHVRRVAAFLNRGVGENQRAIQITVARECDGFGGEQFGFVRKHLHGFIGPELGFLEFAELDEHADLAGPGGGIAGVEFDDFAVAAQGGLKFAILESGLRLRGVI